MKGWTLVAVLALAVTMLAGCTQDDDDDGAGAGGLYATVRFDTTLGSFTVETLPEHAPKTVENFLTYVQGGFYEGLTFHRIAPGFVVQGGGYLPDHETLRQTRDPIENEATLEQPNKQWTLSMARTNDPHSATSQFFVNLEDNANLDPQGGSAGYAVFARVTDGFATIEAMTKVEQGRSFGAGGFWPKEPIVIEEVEQLTGEFTAPPAEPEPPSAMEAGLVTPGTWVATSTTERLMMWAHNAGGGSVDFTWQITAEGGADLPEGWSVSFSPATGSVGPDRRLADAWAWSLATLTLPNTTAPGEYALELRAQNATTPFTLDVGTLAGNVSGPGDEVTVEYRGTFTESGEEFDAGEFPTTLGSGQTVKGFDYGLMGLAMNESAVLVLPPAFAYGYDSSRAPPGMAGKSLTFEVTLQDG